MPEAAYWIERLQLRPHPEGGYYRETYRSAELIGREHLPHRFGGDRTFCTAIYYLLAGQDFSALHRIKQDEIWHFYAGSTLVVSALDAGARLSTIRLGLNLEAGETPQAVIPAGSLFGAHLADLGSYALVGCTVAPGFDFDDFELPSRKELLALYPQHRALIERLSRP